MQNSASARLCYAKARAVIAEKLFPPGAVTARTVQKIQAAEINAEFLGAHRAVAEFCAFVRESWPVIADEKVDVAAFCYNYSATGPVSEAGHQ